MTPGFAVGFRSLSEEVRDRALPVDGALPEWLSGAYVRNGPGRFEAGGGDRGHWFDGLAMLARFGFEGADDEVRYTNRFLRTSTYADARAGRLDAAMFARAGSGGVLDRLSNLLDATSMDNANANVLPFGDRLAAVTETPTLVAVDRETLATEAVLGYDDDLPIHHSTAHPIPDPVGDGFVGYGAQFGPRTKYHVYRFREGETRREPIASIPVDRPAYMHSFALTRRYAVLTEVPFVVNPLCFLRPGRSFVECYRWRPGRGTRFRVLDRSTGAEIAAPRAEAVFAFHHANAFERDGEVIVDLVAYEDASVVRKLFLEDLDRAAPEVAAGRLRRYRLSLDGGPVVEETPSTVALEFPRVSPAVRTRRHRFVYGQGEVDAGRNANELVKVDVTSGTVERWSERGVYVGEPAFVPAPGGTAEDDGVVLSLAVDAPAERSALLVLDGETLEERARAAAPHVVPFGFHGRHFPDR